MNWTTLFLVIAIGALACGKSDRELIKEDEQEQKRLIDEIVAKRGPGVRAQIARVEALINTLDAVPKADLAAKAPALDVPVLLFELHLDDDKANADVLMESELAALNRGMVGTCSRSLYRQRPDYRADHYSGVFDRCLAVRYFLVIRPELLSAPEVGLTRESYSGGNVIADVVMFDLKGKGPAKMVGTFRINASVTKPIEIRQDDSNYEREYRLKEAVREVAIVAAEKAMNLGN